MRNLAYLAPLSLLLVTQSLAKAEEALLRFPLSELPAKAIFEKEKFCLYADFENEKGLRFFLINDSKEDVVLAAQDGDVYIKQEAKVDGKWVRSQAHVDSDCGLSYRRFPSIPPGHYAIWSRSNVVQRAPNDQEEAKETDVRYRIYSSEFFDVVSNEGMAFVSPTMIEAAEYDTLALRFGDVEKIARVASGDVKGGGLDHVDPRAFAIGRLGDFPGDPTAQKAMNSVLERLKNEKEKRQSGNNYDEMNIFRTVAKVYPGESGVGILKEWVEDKELPFRKEALSAMCSEALESPVCIEILDEIIASYDAFLFDTALRLRCKAWEEDEKRIKLKAFLSDPRLSVQQLAKSKSIYQSNFPNKVLRLRSSFDNKVAHARLELTNISNAPIEVKYSHFLDVIEPKLEIYKGGVVELRKDYEELVKSERGETVSTTIPPNASVVFEDIKVLNYFQIPAELPSDHLMLSFNTCLPEFGDVPSGIGTGHILSKRTRAVRAYLGIRD